MASQLGQRMTIRSSTLVYTWSSSPKASLAANAVAENLFAQIDEEGNRNVMLDEIIGHQTNGKELKQQDAFITHKSGMRQQHETTIRWEILLLWKDKSSTWIALEDVKESYPVQLAEHSRSARIAEEPAFAWRVPHTLRKCIRIMAKLKSK